MILTKKHVISLLSKPKCNFITLKHLYTLAKENCWISILYLIVNHQNFGLKGLKWICNAYTQLSYIDLLAILRSKFLTNDFIKSYLNL